MVFNIKYEEEARRGVFFGAISDNELQYQNLADRHAENRGGESAMTVALIGGMDRLERHYRQEADKLGIELKVFNRPTAEISSKIGSADVLIIFTNKVSHRARREVMSMARSRSIPVFQCHSCGVCRLRDCFKCLKNTK